MPGDRQRRRWSEGRGPRRTRTDAARAGHRAGKACPRRRSAYGRPRGQPSIIRGGSRMQESCTYGSVRGAPSNGRPYRNRYPRWSRASPRCAPRCWGTTGFHDSPLERNGFKLVWGFPCQPFWTRLQLLARLTLNTGKHAANQPARLAQLDDGNDRAIVVEGGRSAGHRGTPSVLDAATKLPRPRRPPHGIFRFRAEIGFGFPAADPVPRR